ncbi:hypothetical protein IFM89_023297 [Coptis chinensis]|uniref:Uncharacterized protein n=1 Tax=Coptis chinensis TaxID=261450 RepID=A0A835H4T0_9MAGN|nr:hypothetical protein IFM89_023297 [Coptis chinensis]
MEEEDYSAVHDYIPEKLDPSPVKDEYAPVIFSQETVSHIVSIDMMSGKYGKCLMLYKPKDFPSDASFMAEGIDKARDIIKEGLFHCIGDWKWY